jgi:hypothetical protein
VENEIEGKGGIPPGSAALGSLARELQDLRRSTARRLLLLLRCCPLASPIGQQTDFFRTDLRKASLAQEPTRHSREFSQELIGWTPAAQALLATEASSRHFQSELLPATVRAATLLFLSLPDRLLQCLAHRRHSGFLNPLSHLREACCCRKLDLELSLSLHKRDLLL